MHMLFVFSLQSVISVRKIYACEELQKTSAFSYYFLNAGYPTSIKSNYHPLYIWLKYKLRFAPNLVMHKI